MVDVIDVYPWVEDGISDDGLLDRVDVGMKEEDSVVESKDEISVVQVRTLEVDDSAAVAVLVVDVCSWVEDELSDDGLTEAVDVGPKVEDSVDESEDDISVVEVSKLEVDDSPAVAVLVLDVGSWVEDGLSEDELPEAVDVGPNAEDSVGE